MIPVVSVLLILTLSMVLIRVASVALEHTGMSRESARFQARSAFSGVGFTTSEAESVVGHPVRRRIVMWLMLVGNVGFVGAGAGLILSFLDLRGGSGAWTGAGVLAGGLLLLWWLGASPWVDRTLCHVISTALRRYTDLDTRDYARLLHVRDDYGVSELQVTEGDWLAGRSIGDCGLVREGLLVLGIECPGQHFLGAPGPGTLLRPGDRLLLYGRTPRIAELDLRSSGPEGDEHHARAVAEQDLVSAGEQVRAGRSTPPPPQETRT